MAADVIIKTRKYRLKLNALQRQTIDAWINTCRWVYNCCLQRRQDAFKEKGIKLTAYDLQKKITEVRQVVPDVQAVPAECLCIVTEQLDVAYQKFFKGGGYPKFKGKAFFNSIGFKRLKYKNETFLIPKLGRVRIFKDTVLDGEIRTARITKDGEKYFLCVQYRMPKVVYEATGKSVGIDVGIAKLTSDSDGKTYDNQQWFVKSQARLRILQRKLARQKKGGSNWHKTKELINKLHKKISARREHYLHHISNYYVNNYDNIAIEDLQVKNMVKNSKLAKHIQSCGFGKLRLQLEYKAAWKGRKIVAVSPNYTSQQCSECGFIDADNRKSQKDFVCLQCGHKENADINAAKNILKKSGVQVVPFPS